MAHGTLVHFSPYLQLGSFVCYGEISWTIHLPVAILSTVEKLSTMKGVWTLFLGVWTYDVKVLEFQKNYELKN
jgi:hypothetical protein